MDGRIGVVVIQSNHFRTMATTTPTAQQMEQTLFSEQLRANISLMLVGMKEEFDLDEEKLRAFSTKHLNGVDYKELLEQSHAKTKGGRKKSGGGTRERKTKTQPENQCCARVWGTGSGKDRCSFGAKGDGDFCTRHQNKVKEVGDDNPFHRTEGRPAGLFFGRHDYFQDGEEGVPPYKDAAGKLQVEWNSHDMKTRVEEELESESITRIESAKPKTKSGRKKKSSNSPTTVELASSEALASALGVDDTESKCTGDVVSLTDMLDTDDAVPTSPIVSETVVEEDADGDDAVESGTDASDDDSEEGLEVEEREWEGETYAVDPETNIIYDPVSGEEIGLWDEEDGPVMGSNVDSD